MSAVAFAQLVHQVGLGCDTVKPCENSVVRDLFPDITSDDVAFVNGRTSIDESGLGARIINEV